MGYQDGSMCFFCGKKDVEKHLQNLALVSFVVPLVPPHVFVVAGPSLRVVVLSALSANEKIQSMSNLKETTFGIMILL